MALPHAWPPSRCTLQFAPVQDVLLVEHQRPWPGSCTAAGEGGSAGSARCSCCGADTAEYSLFAVFDGHNGVAAARLVADSLLGILEERLPQGVPPPGCSPTWVPWREDVQLALVETLAELNRLFALKGILAGCTATLVLQVRGPGGGPWEGPR